MLLLQTRGQCRRFCAACVNCCECSFKTSTNLQRALICHESCEGFALNSGSVPHVHLRPQSCWHVPFCQSSSQWCTAENLSYATNEPSKFEDSCVLRRTKNANCGQKCKLWPSCTSKPNHCKISRAITLAATLRCLPFLQ